jgi:hypothetical protein
MNNMPAFEENKGDRHTAKEVLQDLFIYSRALQCFHIRFQAATIAVLHNLHVCMWLGKVREERDDIWVM